MSLQVPASGFKRPDLPIPNRGPSAASGSTLTTPNRLPLTSRGKVQLAPGHSPLDWARLTSTTDLRGVPTFQRVTPSELKRHNRRGDLWMALGGKVYNCTRYLDYHPGGPQQLMRGAGRDATQIFMETHGWVNFESMMSKCLVGVLVPEPEVDSDDLST
ncbi:Putative uncharacterized protein [Taphrina deformans PYCC 5710]|uniref:Cytochrome b5 heme-binding domain-containing protein n=1 Tax=Taphrina deformans (strain PYCC 5710 / ATCC 11124 / CBS 356.35 / IMI 108563 / JCM 9778 / NBRC 8474) TaxID=1097556 RepID=R4X6Q8_TAPDE|nr:Putative uncharacterized protein [Taphrina deformans PYCC 5710]|eukprot:CCG80877.1 Putative uncharacterized protein [Taphrina deformans PYCC 5710]